MVERGPGLYERVVLGSKPGQVYNVNVAVRAFIIKFNPPSCLNTAALKYCRVPAVIIINDQKYCTFPIVSSS